MGSLPSQVKVQYLNPVVKQILQFFRRLLGISVERGSLRVLQEEGGEVDLRDVVIWMGIRGGMRGTMVLIFPADTALALASRLLDRDIKILDGQVLEAIEEMAAFIEQGAQRELQALEPPAALRIEKVVRGHALTAADAPLPFWLEIPFDSELGPFFLRVNGVTQA